MKPTLSPLKSKVKNFLLRQGDRILKAKGYSIAPDNKANIPDSFYESMRHYVACPATGLLSIVFSKDRALQLHTFLCSYFDNIDNTSPITVLYKCSSKAHLQSYNELVRIFSDQNVIFVEEADFRAQLIGILTATPASRIVFYVDDMIFTHKFDYTLLNTINPFESILALSRGSDLTYSTVLLRDLSLPHFTPTSNGCLTFKWNELQELSDWTFPLGVSGYMYARVEILSMLQSVVFKAPNSLESALQTFRPFFINRLGVCPEIAVSVCVHANLTQDEYPSNQTIGTFTIESLLKQWNMGMRINYSAFYNKPMRISQEQVYTFVAR